MNLYKNLNGQSGILAYELGDTFIKVLFKSTGMVYTYTYDTAGVTNIEKMKLLALAGSGLNSFISTQARSLYESKYYRGNMLDL